MTPERLHEIEELYHAAREREAGDRTAFLAESCKDDEDLRREVESLLATARSGSCFLEQPIMLQARNKVDPHEDGGPNRLAQGLELGPYVIEARLGAGGMGEVYRAKDKRLNRTVALKVLSPQLAHSAGWRQRFEREAETISSLNHPHICTLYDIGRQGDIDYLVMELLEGDTVAQRLKRGPLPLFELLEIAIEIASALAVAHAAGIVHRDLQPGNVMLTKSGAKLLDFGLAKVRVATGATEETHDTSAPITAPGMVMGTVQYMSPEQIRGHEADSRSDLFAFGAMLFEMLTGRRAFAGESQMALMNAILEKDPEPLNPSQPLMPALERLVKRCLAKSPEDRWQSTNDLESELRWIAESGAPVALQAGGEFSKVGGRHLLDWALAVVPILAIIAAGVAYWLLPRAPADAFTAEIRPPDKVRFLPGVLGGAPAISPNGHVVAFSGAAENGPNMLWVRSLDSLAARPLPATEGAADPFWSPDSRALGFFAGGKLKTIQVAGGTPVFVANSSLNESGGSWSRHGTILFVPDFAKGIYKVSATGGEPVPVIRADPHKLFEYFAAPRFLPDGEHFLYMSLHGDRGPGTYFASLDGKEHRFVVGGRTSAAFASGHLLYLRDGILVAHSFDADRGALQGDQAYHIAESIPRAYVRGVFDASENGVLIYRTDRGANEKRLIWLDRTGLNLGATGEAGDYFDVRLSPDGRRLASNAGLPYSEISVDDLVRSVRMRFTIDPETDEGVPVWSPDGSRIAFEEFGPHVRTGIYQRYSNGAGDAELLVAVEAKVPIWPTSWSPDGRFILYSRGSSPSQPEDSTIWVLPTGGDRKPRVFVFAQVRAYDGQFSPDGRWVAYTSEQSGRAEVYVVPFEAGRILTDGSGPKNSDRTGRWQVSASGGRCPRWRKDGKEIFYLSAASQMMAAEIEAGADSIAVRIAGPLFTCPISIPSFPSSAPYDVSPDGSKFVINTFSDENTQLILRVNWTADLKKQ